jgi:hypothetical protein
MFFTEKINEKILQMLSFTERKVMKFFPMRFVRSIKENPHPVRVNISNILYVHIKVKTFLNEYLGVSKRHSKA